MSNETDQPANSETFNVDRDALLTIMVEEESDLHDQLLSLANAGDDLKTFAEWSQYNQSVTNGPDQGIEGRQVEAVAVALETLASGLEALKLKLSVKD